MHDYCQCRLKVSICQVVLSVVNKSLSNIRTVWPTNRCFPVQSVSKSGTPNEPSNQEDCQAKVQSRVSDYGQGPCEWPRNSWCVQISAFQYQRAYFVDGSISDPCSALQLLSLGRGLKRESTDVLASQDWYLIMLWINRTPPWDRQIDHLGRWHPGNRKIGVYWSRNHRYHREFSSIQETLVKISLIHKKHDWCLKNLQNTIGSQRMLDNYDFRAGEPCTR